MDTEFLADLDRFTLLVRKRVSTAYTGARRSVKVGRGISPVGYREYRKGDDFKFVDWKVYARTEKLYVREHEEERSLSVHLLLDASSSMAFGEKFAFASMISVGFAYMAIKENEKFSISKFGEMLEPGETRGGRRNLFRAMEDLDRTAPSGGTDFKRTAEQFDLTIRSTSLVVVISDLLDGIESVVSGIYKLSAHDLILIQILDPAEADLDFEGDLRFIDMESKESVMTSVTPKVRDEYKSKMNEHNRRIRETCDVVGADFFTYTTETPIFEVFSDVNSRAKVWRA
ncbi:MAG: DUF58 domain-containing protein [Methanothrix sp.]|jgi:uncharacterized protein (DUF58 family)|uniref:DUF58 domain-containing protein n=1 Tax=Methanothrix harundinacea TaxID=301375 RepID=A0A101IJV6_9EURY|nr:MAG: Uncharacterized protein XD72_0070 [Methanothrix harundinacea]MDD3709564.1 DUF58 domain-containing protein [Methanothrix sp.]MDI9398117.1 DUF58 domain-containing protein [Euryarchaeota archaeon]KUK96501.1 MAG: Uncharacterized protein XE07_1068 [Methanothrix harundinacea]MCP1392372.1 DUF58 domain-containing protein [Methanothrix harundinacea]